VIRLLKFFAASRLHPRHSGLLLAACVAMGIWTMKYDPREIDSSLGIVLMVQLFLVSTAYSARAFAGHFDMVMVAGASRSRAALAHWIVSVAPGAFAWLALAVVGLVLGSEAAVSALVGRRLVAFLIVSSVGWVAGYRLPRGAAGVLWMTVLVAVLLQHNLRALSMSLDQGAHTWLRTTAIVLVCPFLLIGDKPPVAALPLIGAVSLSMAALFGAVFATERLDVVLRERG
jgi:hypothetical protein